MDMSTLNNLDPWEFWAAAVMIVGFLALFGGIVGHSFGRAAAAREPRLKLVDYDKGTKRLLVRDETTGKSEEYFGVGRVWRRRDGHRVHWLECRLEVLYRAWKIEQTLAAAAKAREEE